jgi:hypothetical protein
MDMRGFPRVILGLAWLVVSRGAVVAVRDGTKGPEGFLTFCRRIGSTLVGRTCACMARAERLSFRERRCWTPFGADSVMLVRGRAFVCMPSGRKGVRRSSFGPFSCASRARQAESAGLGHGIVASPCPDEQVARAVQTAR